MQYGFDTDSAIHGKAALLLYAIYRSRSKESSLTGVDTWKRFSSYLRGSLLKSENTAQFVQQFCRKAGCDSIKPRYLATNGMVKIDDFGTMAQVDGLHNYQLDIFADQEVYDILQRESQYVILLVRDRLQKEKTGGLFDDSETNIEI